MTQGTVTKLVTSFGSRWGRIQPVGETREIFFNVTNLDPAFDFLSLTVGQMVEFVEHEDHISGSHAESVVPAASDPVR